MSSIFTQIINRAVPASIVYEDDAHLAFLDINPLEKGHTLVVPKIEYKTIFDMPEEAYTELQKRVYMIALHYEKIFGCGVNILQNNKEISGQSVDHVHVHVIPRREKKDFFNLDVYEKYREGEMGEYQKKLAL